MPEKGDLVVLQVLRGQAVNVFFAQPGNSKVNSAKPFVPPAQIRRTASVPPGRTLFQIACAKLGILEKLGLPIVTNVLQVATNRQSPLPRVMRVQLVISRTRPLGQHPVMSALGASSRASRRRHLAKIAQQVITKRRPHHPLRVMHVQLVISRIRPLRQAVTCALEIHEARLAQ